MKYPYENPNYKDRIYKTMEGQHFMKLIGFEITHLEPGRIEGALMVGEKHLQQNGFLHGGVTSTISDIVMGFAALTLVPDELKVVTGDLKVYYLNPAVAPKVVARGWVIKSGKKVNFCEAEIWAIDGNRETMVAKASAMMMNI